MVFSQPSKENYWDLLKKRGVWLCFLQGSVRSSSFFPPALLRSEGWLSKKSTQNMKKSPLQGRSSDHLNPLNFPEVPIFGVFLFFLPGPKTPKATPVVNFLGVSDEHVIFQVYHAPFVDSLLLGLSEKTIVLVYALFYQTIPGSQSILTPHWPKQHPYEKKRVKTHPSNHWSGSQLADP